MYDGHMTFHGTKVALYIGDKLLLIQRDDKPGLRFAGLWDFPGGGREGSEIPFACAAREIFEELALKVQPEMLQWERAYPTMHDPTRVAYFLVIKLPESAEQEVVFGNEGQGWKMVTVDEFLQATDVVEPLKPRLRDYLASL